MERERERSGEQETARQRSLEQALDETKAQLAELTGLRLRRLLSDEEYAKERARLCADELRLQRQLASPDPDGGGFEPVRQAITMRNQAADWFKRGTDADKRLIFEITGSNPRLSSRILSIEAAKPFVSVSGPDENLHVWGLVEDVRTRRSAKLNLLAKKFVENTRSGLAVADGGLAIRLNQLHTRFLAGPTFVAAQSSVTKSPKSPCPMGTIAEPNGTPP